MANQKIKNELLKSYFKAREIAVGDGKNYDNHERQFLHKKWNYELERLYDFKDGFARIEYSPTEEGFIDKKGNPFPKDGTRFYSVGDFHNGYATVGTKDGDTAWGESIISYRLIDKNGQFFPKDRDFSEIRPFHEGIAVVCLARHYESGFEMWGFIKENGEILNGNYENVSDFHNGLAKVEHFESGVNWGYVDTNGDEVPKNGIRFYKCDEPSEMKNGLLKVIFDWDEIYSGFMDKKGNIYDNDMKPLSGDEWYITKWKPAKLQKK